MRKLKNWTGVFFIVLLVNTAYIAAFASPTIFYMTNVLFHLGLGLALAIALVLLLKSDRDLRRGIPAAVICFLVSLGFGVFLTFWGNVTGHRWALWSHIVAASVGIAALVPYIWKQAATKGAGWRRFKQAFEIAVIFLAFFPAASSFYRKQFPNPNDRIRNPLTAPATPDGEGAGPKSPFFPSSANTNKNGIIPSNFFMDSKTCGECHKDIYNQWNSSSHHFASFNNQFYRKSIEYMQDTVGTQPSKWCAGCHDHAVFF